MPKVYLLSEADRGKDPWDNGPVECLVEPVDWSAEFEAWYADENYVLIDNDGCSYRLVWSDQGGFSIRSERQSEEMKSLFYTWLRIWIAALKPGLRDKLRLSPSDWTDAELEGLIKDRSRAHQLIG